MSLQKHRLFNAVLLTLLFACFVTFGFASNETSLNLALVVLGIIIIERFIYGSKQIDNFWDYVKASYPTIAVEARKHVAGPIIMDGIQSLTVNNMLKISLPGNISAILTDISVVRHVFPAYSAAPSPNTFGLRYLVLSTPIHTPTPHIFIDGRSQNKFGQSSTDLWSLSKRVSRKEKLQELEGDFYKYFDIYASEKQYLSSLTIVTPDTMLALRDKGYSFDYEIHDGTLYVIHEAKLKDYAEYQSFFDALTACLKELVPQIAKHSYDDTHKKLRLGQKKLAFWALVYSARIIGWILLKAVLFITAGIMTGVIIDQLI